MRSKTVWAASLCSLGTFVSAPAFAGSMQPVIGRATAVSGSPATFSVEIILLNDGSAPAPAASPPRIDAIVELAGRRWPVMLQHPAPMAETAVPAGGFARIIYSLQLPQQLAQGESATLVMPGGGAIRLTGATRLAERANSEPAPAPAPAPALAATTIGVPPQGGDTADADTGNAFTDRLSFYDASYAVAGSGTQTDALIQLSVKYRLFSASDGGVRGRLPGLEGLHFGYMQRLYFDLGARSTPLVDVSYMPELFYLVPAIPLDSGRTVGGRIGIRHESNGKDGLDSRTINTLYVQPVVSLPLGDYRLSVGPRLWTYVGSRKDNPDIRRFRGNTGVFAEIGRDDGFRLSTQSRFNPGSGKGAINANLSYPLEGLGIDRLGLYLFATGFTGYGETLLDYDRKVSRLRIGLGISR